MESRRIARIDGLTTLHDDAIRLGRAAIMPGQWAQHDPFLSMMNDRFGRGAFGPHPHRGFETLTYVISGQLRHEDNQGGGGTLGPGDAQWMTAGRGVVHNELPEGSAPVHVLQLWINLPQARKLTPFRYQDLRGVDMPLRREPGALVRVFSGASGNVQGPAQNHTPITMLDIRMEAGARLTQTLPGSYNGFVYVLQGAGRFGADGQVGRQDQTLWLDRLPQTLRACGRAGHQRAGGPGRPERQCAGHRLWPHGTDFHPGRAGPGGRHHLAHRQRPRGRA